MTINNRVTRMQIRHISSKNTSKTFHLRRNRQFFLLRPNKGAERKARVLQAAPRLATARGKNNGSEEG